MANSELFYTTVVPQNKWITTSKNQCRTQKFFVWYMYQDWDKIIGEDNIKQTDWQKLWLYFFDAKLLNWIIKKIR